MYHQEKKIDDQIEYSREKNVPSLDYYCLLLKHVIIFFQHKGMYVLIV